MTVACQPLRVALNYEDGFDTNQSDTLKSLKPKQFETPVHHWEKTFNTVFPDWTTDLPSPCKPYHQHVCFDSPTDKTKITRQPRPNVVLGLLPDFVAKSLDRRSGETLAIWGGRFSSNWPTFSILYQEHRPGLATRPQAFLAS